MESIVEMATAFLREHRDWAGPVIGVIAFCESLVLVGLAVPATALMMVFGTLLGLGVLEPVPVLIGAIVGATVGDAASYAIGQWVGPAVVYRRPLSRYRAEVAKSRLFFRKYGFATVFIGRFLGPLRSTVPLVAGMLRMKPRSFQLANVGSAILWAPVLLAPGWLASTGMKNVSDNAASVGNITIAVLVASVALAGFIVWTLRGKRRAGRERVRVRARR